MPSSDRFLLLQECLAVIRDLHRRKKRSVSSHLNLIVFRFACCCGLRRSEIAGLKFTDLVLAGPRPCVIVRRDNTKGQKEKRRSRKVPLNWDAGTLKDITEWVERRHKKMGATPNDPVICGVSKVNYGKPLTGWLLARRWKAAIRCLGPERRAQLSIHCGRHSFTALAFDAGHSAAELQEALGHSSIHTTSVYIHAIPRDVPDVFAVRT